MDVISFVSDNIVWGVPTLALMLFSGIFFSVKTGFFQVRQFPHILRKTVFAKPEKSGGISPFASMCQTLAATLGTGNIVGVAAALSIGGAGAVFWMWVSAIFGMMTGFAENVLGILYRRKHGEKYFSGAMYYIREGLSEREKTRFLARPLSVMFALMCVVAGFGMGSAAQMNSASEALSASFGIPPLVTGIVLAALAGVIIFGGVKRISAFTARLVPIMSGLYIAGCLYIIIANFAQLPSAFSAIFRSAFGLSQIGGGIAGAAVKSAFSTGIKRGVFSNEAGLGTSVFAHSQSEIKDPVECGMWSVFEVFFDTVFMCGITAVMLLTARCNAPLMDNALNCVTEKTQYFRVVDSNSFFTDGILLPEKIKCTGVHGEEFFAKTPSLTVYTNLFSVTGIVENGEIISAKIEPVRGSGLCERAFASQFGKPAGAVLSILITMFAFSTVVGWSFYGAECCEFLFGERSRKIFCAAFVVFSAVGANFSMTAAWGVADILNGLMAIPNLIAVLCLSGKVFSEVRRYEKAASAKRKPPKRVKRRA